VKQRRALVQVLPEKPLRVPWNHEISLTPWPRVAAFAVVIAGSLLEVGVL